MENNQERILAFIESAMTALDTIPPRERRNFDGVEIVAIDNVNGNLQHNRAYCLIEVLDMIKIGSKPVGLILLDWGGSEKMKITEFPGLNQKEQELLMHAFAEAQDERKEIEEDDGD